MMNARTSAQVRNPIDHGVREAAVCSMMFGKAAGGAVLSYSVRVLFLHQAANVVGYVCHRNQKLEAGSPHV